MHNSKKIPTAVLALVLLLAGLVVNAVPAEAADKPAAAGKISPKVFKPLKEALELANAQKYAEAETMLKEADAVSDKTPFDQFQIDDLQGFVALKQSKFHAAAVAYERELESGFLPPEQVNDKLRLLSQLWLQAEPRDLKKAGDYGTRWLQATGSKDPMMLGLVGQTSYFSDNFGDAARYMQEAVAGAVAAGQKPDENWLLILQNSNSKLKNNQGTLDATVELLRYYPRKEHWATITSALLKQAGTNDNQILQVFRLMYAADVMGSADEFTEAANVANRAGYPGEALKFLERGYSSKVLETSGDKAKSQQLLTETRQRAGADQKSLPQFEKEAMAAKQGEADVKLGEAYLSFDQATKAIEAIQRGIAKGGVKSPNDAQLSLGRAYLAAGNVPEATKAFGQVGNAQPDQLIASLWAIHAAAE